MIKLLKISNWVMAFMSVTVLLFIASCGGSSDPDPTPPVEVIPPAAFTYPAATVAVGATGSAMPSAVTGTSPVFSIKDNGGADFLTIDASTGELSVGAESTTGTYSVIVKAANAKGSADGTIEITIGVNPDFDPTGKGYTWKYFMNQDEPWTMTGLDGDIAELPFPSVDIPTGWPAGWPALDPNDWNEQTLFPYLAVNAISELLFQVPSDIACGEVGESGDQLYFEVDDDLSLMTNCHIGDVAGQRVLIGTSSISYKDGKFSWALTLYSQIEIEYIIDNPTSETFIDPLDPQDANGTPNQFPALRGMVEKYTIPTNVFDEAGILTSLSLKKVEVILEVSEL